MIQFKRTTVESVGLLSVFAETLLVAAIVFGTLAFAEETTITATVFAAHQETPLKIVGFVMPDKIGDAPKVVVHNASSKTVVRFYVVPLSANPDKAMAQGDARAELSEWEASPDGTLIRLCRCDGRPQPPMSTALPVPRPMSQRRNL